MIITSSIIREVKPFSEGLNDSKRVNPYIIEAERIDLVNVIGDAFYTDLVDGLAESPVQAKWSNLIDGLSYTYNNRNYTFWGLKYALAYWSYARLIQSQQINIVSSGLVRKTFDNSEVLDTRAIKIEVDKCNEIAMSYARQCIDYIKRNISTYPTFDCGDEGKQGSYIITEIG